MTILPPIITERQFESLDRKNRVFHEAATVVARRHGLASDTLELFPTGSVFVFACGDKFVIKLFPPHEKTHFRTEQSTLQALSSKSGVRVPEVHYSDYFEGWPYIIMSRLPGIPVQNIWQDLDNEDRQYVVEQTADIVRTLHQVSTEHVPLPRPNWQEFIEKQKKNCLRQQKQFNVDQHWLNMIPDFLASITFKFDAARSVILHTEVMRQHLIVDTTGKRPIITGLIDFEPSMIGDFEYELASVCLFVTGKDTPLFRIFLEKYKPELRQDLELRKRILAYILLHRYNNLPWFLEVMPQVKNFQDCLRLWFH